MALTKCPECDRDVSSSAAACPACGHPMAARASAADGVPVTTQHTAKGWKAHMAIGAVVTGAGVVVMMMDAPGSPLGALIAAGGVLWYIGARIGAWWYHA